MLAVVPQITLHRNRMCHKVNQQKLLLGIPKAGPSMPQASSKSRSTLDLNNSGSNHKVNAMDFELDHIAA